MPHHIHQMRPIWLLLVSPADLTGWQRILTYAECTICHVRGTLAGEQNPQALNARVLEDGA